MSEQDHSATEQLVDRYFAGTLSPDHVDAMRAHLRDCDRCRARYDRLAQAEQKTVGASAAQALSDRRLLDTIVGAGSGRAVAAPARRWWLAFVLAPTAAVAAAFAFAIFLRPPADDQLAARGTSAIQAPVGIGVAGVDPAHHLVYDARRPEGVALDQRLRFSYSNAGGAQYLFLFGVDDALQPYWYFPLPEEQTGLRIERGPQASRLTLPYETELARRHHVGRLRVVGLFTAEPIALATVDQLLAAARTEQRPLERIAWPLPTTMDVVEIQLVAGAAK
jgi:hypothetical protein